MAEFAEEKGLQSQFELEIIPGQGHTMSGLIPYSQEALISRYVSNQMKMLPTRNDSIKR